MPLIIDIVNSRCKICKLNRRVRLIESSVNSNTRDSSNGTTEQLYEEGVVGDLLLMELCYTVIDGSFSPDKLELISAYQVFAIGEKIFGKGGFIAHMSKDMQLVFVAEL